MSVSKIEQLIEEIYDFIENCKVSAFSSTKVIVPKDELYDFLDELRLRTPDEIKRCQKIISNRDAIIGDAEKKAQSMLVNAQQHTSQIIENSEVVQSAYQKADEILQQATEEANQILAAAHMEGNQIRESALYYTSDLLGDAEKALVHALESSKSKYTLLVEALQGNLSIIENNRKELAVTSENPYSQDATKVSKEEEYDDYNFEEDTFLEDIEG